ncbi:MAG: hypothetical protein ACXVIJ_12285, partial [Thermoanaerobaculia bacterium]
MRWLRLTLMNLALIFIVTTPLLPQSTTQQPQDPIKARVEAHRGDFDYLLGDWEFTYDNQQYGKGRGYWSAARLGDEGPVVDEFRIVGDAGETYYVTRTLRAYNAALDQWDLVSTEGGSGLQNIGTGHRNGGQVSIEQKFGAGDKASVLRIRSSDIGPDHFSWASDRSTDGGKTWVTRFQTLEAHRIGPPRTI